MTLTELVAATKLKEVISIPSSLQNFEIENPDDFCRYAQAKYLKSIDFKNDLIKILNLLVQTSTPLEDFSLQFIRERSGNLHLILFNGFVESF